MLKVITFLYYILNFMWYLNDKKRIDKETIYKQNDNKNKLMKHVNSATIIIDNVDDFCIVY